MGTLIKRTNRVRSDKRVNKKGDSHMIDKINTDELLSYLQEQGLTRLRKSITIGNYKPQPVRKVELLNPD